MQRKDNPKTSICDRTLLSEGLLDIQIELNNAVGLALRNTYTYDGPYNSMDPRGDLYVTYSFIIPARRGRVCADKTKETIRVSDFNENDITEAVTSKLTSLVMLQSIVKREGQEAKYRKIGICWRRRPELRIVDNKVQCNFRCTVHQWPEMRK